MRAIAVLAMLVAAPAAADTGVRAKLELAEATMDGDVAVLPLGARLEADVTIENGSDKAIVLRDSLALGAGWMLVVNMAAYGQFHCVDSGVQTTTPAPVTIAAHATHRRHVQCNEFGMAASTDILPPGLGTVRFQYEYNGREAGYWTGGFVTPDVAFRIGPVAKLDPPPPGKLASTGTLGTATVALVDAAVHLDEGRSGVPHNGALFVQRYQLSLAVRATAPIDVIALRGEFSDGKSTYPLTFMPFAQRGTAWRLWTGHVDRGQLAVKLVMDAISVKGIAGIVPSGRYRYRIGLADASRRTVWLETVPLKPIVHPLPPLNGPAPP